MWSIFEQVFERPKVLARRRSPDDRADGIGAQGRARPVLRRPHLHPGGNPVSLEVLAGGL